MTFEGLFQTFMLIDLSLYQGENNLNKCAYRKKRIYYNMFCKSMDCENGIKVGNAIKEGRSLFLVRPSFNNIFI